MLWIVLNRAIIFDLKKVIFIQFQKDSLNAKFVNTMEQMRADLSGVREKVTQQFSNEQLIDDNKVPFNLITEKIWIKYKTVQKIK